MKMDTEDSDDWWPVLAGGKSWKWMLESREPVTSPHFTGVGASSRLIGKVYYGTLALAPF